MTHQNQIIKSIRLFNINENYLVFKDGYCIDGAIEVVLSDAVLTLGWDFDDQIYVFTEAPYNPADQAYELNLEEFKEVKNMMGKKIQGVEVVKTEFEMVVDYTMKTEKVECVTGIRFDFGNGLVTVVSASDFQVHPENRIPFDLAPDLQGNLLIDLFGKY